jgi:hypothetical protein
MDITHHFFNCGKSEEKWQSHFPCEGALMGERVSRSGIEVGELLFWVDGL